MPRRTVLQAFGVLAALAALGIPGRPAAATSGQTPVLGLTPFVNRTGNPDDEAVTAVLNVRLRAALGRLPAIALAPPRDPADWLLEGTVVVGPEQVRVIAQLTEVRTNYSRWAASFYGEASALDVLATAIAAAAVSQLPR